MITKQQALTCDSFTFINTKGKQANCRRNGTTKTWVTRPNDFRLPIKHSLYNYGYITHLNASEFTAK